VSGRTRRSPIQKLFVRPIVEVGFDLISQFTVLREHFKAFAVLPYDQQAEGGEVEKAEQDSPQASAMIRRGG
jgi:hypothetical protein